MEYNSILQKLDQLPDEAQKEIISMLENLITEYTNGKPSNDVRRDEFSFDWEGGLSELDENVTSVDLQHKANQWR